MSLKIICFSIFVAFSWVAVAKVRIINEYGNRTGGPHSWIPNDGALVISSNSDATVSHFFSTFEFLSIQETLEMQGGVVRRLYGYTYNFEKGTWTVTPLAIFATPYRGRLPGGETLVDGTDFVGRTNGPGTWEARLSVQADSNGNYDLKIRASANEEATVINLKPVVAPGWWKEPLHLVHAHNLESRDSILADFLNNWLERIKMRAQLDFYDLTRRQVRSCKLLLK